MAIRRLRKKKTEAKYPVWLSSPQYREDQEAASNLADKALAEKREIHNKPFLSHFRWDPEWKSRQVKGQMEGNKEEKEDVISKDLYWAQYEGAVRPYIAVRPAPFLERRWVHGLTSAEKEGLLSILDGSERWVNESRRDFEVRYLVRVSDRNISFGQPCMRWEYDDMLNFWGLPVFPWRNTLWDPKELFYMLLNDKLIPEGYVLVNFPKFVCPANALCIEPGHVFRVPKFGDLHFRYLLDSFQYPCLNATMRRLLSIVHSSDFNEKSFYRELSGFLIVLPHEEIRRVLRFAVEFDSYRLHVDSLRHILTWLDLPDGSMSRNECIRQLRNGESSHGNIVYKGIIALEVIQSFPFETKGDRTKSRERPCHLAERLTAHIEGRERRMRRKRQVEKIIVKVDIGTNYRRNWEAYHGRLHPRTVMKLLLSGNLN